MSKLITCKDCGHQISKNATQCPNCGARIKKTSILMWILVIIIGLPLLGALMKGCQGENNSTSASSSNTQTTTATASSSAKITKQSETSQVVEPKDTLTASQKNAIRQAKQYLEFKGFSHDGLIQQLSSSAGDGFSPQDAKIAVDSLNVDWNEQAAKSAKDYLNLQGFSCKGLIQQLSSSAGDKFTKSQAEYGAKQAGVCN